MLKNRLNILVSVTQTLRNFSQVGDPSRSLDRNPYSPSHHKKWKRAHQRPEGEFPSEVTREDAKKIVNRYYFQHYLFKFISIWVKTNIYMCYRKFII